MYRLLMLMPLTEANICNLQKQNIDCPLRAGGFREKGEIKCRQALITRVGKIAGHDYGRIGSIHFGHVSGKLVTNYSKKYTLVTTADHIITVYDPLCIYRFPTYQADGTYRGFSTHIYNGEKAANYNAFDGKFNNEIVDFSIKPCLFLDTEVPDLLKRKNMDLCGFDYTLISIRNWLTYNHFGDDSTSKPQYAFAPFMAQWNYDQSSELFQPIDINNTFPINTLCYSDSIFDLAENKMHHGSGPHAKFYNDGDNVYRDGKKNEP